MSTTAALHRIVVPNVSAQLWIASEEHLESTVRELQLIHIGMSERTTGMAPAQVLELLSDLLATYAKPRAEVRRQVENALQAGADRVDLVLDLPLDATDAARQFVTLTEEADRLAQEGLLLNVCATPEVREFRRRLADAVVAALDDTAAR